MSFLFLKVESYSIDSDGDGYGDLGGLLSNLPYLSSLGVDTVWLTPIYEVGPHHYTTEKGKGQSMLFSHTHSLRQKVEKNSQFDARTLKLSMWVL